MCLMFIIKFIEYTLDIPSATFDVRSRTPWLKHQEGVSEAHETSRIWPRFACKLSVLMRAAKLVCLGKGYICHRPMTHTLSHKHLLHPLRGLKSPRLIPRVMGAFSTRWVLTSICWGGVLWFRLRNLSTHRMCYILPFWRRHLIFGFKRVKGIICINYILNLPQGRSHLVAITFLPWFAF